MLVIHCSNQMPALGQEWFICSPVTYWQVYSSGELTIVQMAACTASM
jgi:hypothetical protein